MISGNDAAKRKDPVHQPLSFCLWWGLAIAVGVTVGFLHLSFRLSAGICAVSFAWMATLCLLNARRCHRVHCYLSGSAFLLGAIYAGLAATDVLEGSARGFGNLVSTTLLLAL